MSRDGGADATVCPSCGTRADAGDRFCSACGTALAADRDGESSGPTARARSPPRPGDHDDPADGGTGDGEPGESEEMLWATDPASSEAVPDGSTAGDAGDADDDGDVDVGRGGAAPGGRDGDEERHRSDDERPTHEEEDWTDAADGDEQSLESWQKRCPECESVLVAQAVRCTGCGASQPDVDGSADDADGPAGTSHDTRAADTGSDGPESPSRRHGAGESNYRERPRRERPERARNRDGRRTGPREDRARATDAGGGEVQYERERRAEPVSSDREPAREPAGGYRERPRRDQHRGEPPRPEPVRRPAPERDRGERLAERQAARRADADAPYEPAVPSSRWWAGVLVPAVLTFLGAAVGIAADPTAVAAGTVPWVGDGAGMLELGVVLTPTLAPFALYFDRRYVAHETGRKPSAAYYLVAVPYLNLVVTGLYLWWRQQWLASA